MNPVARLLAWLRPPPTSTPDPELDSPPEPKPEGRPVIACNYVEATKVASLGAAAFVTRPWVHQKNQIVVCVRSRSGRWVEKYEAVWRLGCFRPTVLPQSDPRAADDRLFRDNDPAWIGGLQSASDSARHRRGLPIITLDDLQRLRRPARPNADSIAER